MSSDTVAYGPRWRDADRRTNEQIERDDETFGRIVEVISEALAAPSRGSNTISETAHRIRATRILGPIKHLLDELAFLDRFDVYQKDADGSEARLLREGLWLQIVLAHQERMLELDGWLPAAFFETKFGIKPSRLRKAVERQQLINKKLPSGKTLYPFGAVARLWPEDVGDRDRD